MTKIRAAKRQRALSGSCLFMRIVYMRSDLFEILLPSMLFFPAGKKLKLLLVGKLLGIRIVSRSQTAEKYQNL